MSTPEIPGEIVYYILTNLSDDSLTLFKCALVSKDWLACSRSIYCSRPYVGIRIPEDYKRPTSLLKHMVENPNSTFRRYIQNLAISPCSKYDRDFQIVHRLLQDFLPSIAPNIRKLMVTVVPVGVLQEFINAERTCVRPLAQVESIAFEHVYMSTHELASFLSHFAHLRRCAIGKCYAYNKGTAEYDAPLLPPTTTHLRLSNTSSGAIPFLSQIEKNAGSLQSLHVTPWTGLDREVARQAGKIIDHARSALQNLTISYIFLTVYNSQPQSNNPGDASKKLSLVGNTGLKMLHISNITLWTNWYPIIELLDTISHQEDISLHLSFDTWTQQRGGLAKHLADWSGLEQMLCGRTRLLTFKELRINLVFNIENVIPSISKRNEQISFMNKVLSSYHSVGKLFIEFVEEASYFWDF